MEALVLSLLANAALAADPVAGRDLAVRWCSSCHVVPGAPPPQPAQDGVPSFAAIARDYAGKSDGLKGFLVAPHEPMPPLELGVRQIDDLVAFLLAPPTR